MPRFENLQNNLRTHRHRILDINLLQTPAHITGQGFDEGGSVLQLDEIERADVGKVREQVVKGGLIHVAVESGSGSGSLDGEGSNVDLLVPPFLIPDQHLYRIHHPFPSAVHKSDMREIRERAGLQPRRDHLRFGCDRARGGAGREAQSESSSGGNSDKVPGRALVPVESRDGYFLGMPGVGVVR
ncbi:hypothetical protein BDV98DRAFT_574532 [Pterulicium gracile]|uniref:Uncharacterized protein n=1 Tax=Pterulicium gracile TaxID=1884261 RepID=A0A5C3Q664_9AGAR|nr:hypothetical protein BDV98DRAFT_574532 [Pterula gracilis]